MPSKAKGAFTDNSKDIAELRSIHQEISGQGAGRKYGVEVLNRSAVVFITACWESYVEDLATEAFDFLLANCPTSSAIPQKVRVHATKQIWEQKNSTKVWDIADTGWRRLLQDHKAATLQHWLGPFNTPKTGQVNALYEELLGIKKLSSAWCWQGLSAANAERKLDAFIQIRGDIAHRLNPEKKVLKNLGTNYHEHVKKLVECCENEVRAHLRRLTEKAPW
ncbi:hypothetical protein BH11PSE10_BH11PSE10_20970 [soil metagenome]